MYRGCQIKPLSKTGGRRFLVYLNIKIPIRKTCKFSNVKIWSLLNRRAVCEFGYQPILNLALMEDHPIVQIQSHIAYCSQVIM